MAEPLREDLFSDTAVASSSEDDLSPSNSNSGQQQQGSVSLNVDVFHAQRQNSNHELNSISELAPSESISPSLKVPIFNKRPLSDTPVGSSNTSPVYSESPSGENSPELIPNVGAVLNVPPIKLNKRRGTAVNLPGITKTHSNSSPTTEFIDSEAGSKLVIVMVGLPARGKSYITNKLTRYLNWLQHDCRVFNVGNTRRKDAHSAHIGPSSGPLPDHQETTEHDANFFNPENPETTKIREKWAMDTLDQLLDYLLNGTGSVGIFDATNSTTIRRKRILDKIRERNKDIKVLYLETICTDNAIVQKNIRLKLSGPDYKNMDPELALKDFQERLRNYEKAYQTLNDEEGLQYIKMIDVGKKVVAYNIHGFLASQAIYYLLNFNLNERQIWITRHGESEDNVLGKIGGDAPLTKRGDRFSKTLARFIDVEKKRFREEQIVKYTELLNKGEVSKIPDEPRFNVWTSMLQRSVQTSNHFPDDTFDVKEIRILNELCAGYCEGLTYEEIQNKYPSEFNARISNKLKYRYPGIGGESYLDVINRLRPIINEVERTVDHVLLITHRVVARVLLGYFMNLDRDNITTLDIPLHCVYLLEPKPYGVEWSLYEYDEHKDWFFKVSQENIHKKKVKEVEVTFRERKYSVVPTAPPRFSHRSTSSSSTSGTDHRLYGNPLESVNKARGVSAAQLQRNPFEHRNVNPFELDKLAEKLNKIKSSRS